MPSDITVLSFNIWGIFNSRHRTARMKEFATKVANYDIILIQEMFSKSDFELVIRSLPEEVRETRFFQRFPSAFYGSGLAVISRFPIKSTLFFTYPLQGYPERVLHGDYYANKGVALIRVGVPTDGKSDEKNPSQQQQQPCEDVVLYTTHFVASYEKSSRLVHWQDELYLSVRLSQSISLANFISSTSRPSDRIIIAGDFNATQRSLELSILLILLHQRGYRILSALPPSIIYRPFMTDQERKLNAATLTFSDTNIFNTKKEGWFVKGGDVPCQIDHMFYTSNTLCLSRYDDCPDAPIDYPFQMPINNVEKPVGVVVFTRNDEVRVPSRKGPWEWALHWLTTIGNRLSSGVFMPFAPRAAVIDRWSPLELPFCPLSDHYGVAARFRLDEERSSSTENWTTCNEEENNNNNNNSMRSALTEEEVEVLRKAVTFLDDSVKKLHRESKLCVWFGIATAVIVVGNILFLEYQEHCRKKHTGLVLEQLFNFAKLRGNDIRNIGGGGREGSLWSNSQHVVRGWLRKIFSKNSNKIPESKDTKPERVMATDAAMDYDEMASRLHSRGHWFITPHIVTICGSISSAALFAIAFLQRSANAKVMEEQVSFLKRSLSGWSGFC